METMPVAAPANSAEVEEAKKSLINHALPKAMAQGQTTDERLQRQLPAEGETFWGIYDSR